MKKLTWAARSFAAVSGAVLVGALVAPSAMADSHRDAVSPVYGTDYGRGCGTTERDISSTVVDYDNETGLFETVFRATTNRYAEAFLNDSRDTADWFSLALVPGAPRCFIDVAVSVTEADPGHLFISAVDNKGVVYEATCDTSGTTILDGTNIAAACGVGFVPNPGTPR